MLVLLFCLISFTRTTIVYLSQKVLARMERKAISASRRLDDDDQHEQATPPDSLENVLEEDDTGILDDSVFARNPAKSTRRCNSVIDCMGNTDDFPPRSFSTPTQRTRRIKSSPETLESSDQGYSTTPENRRGDRTSRHVDAIDANVGNVPNDDDDDDSYSRTESVAVSIPVRKDDLCYNMTHKNRGRCVIFNHENFDTGFDKREGSSSDAKRIETTFENLGFDVEILNDLLHSDVLAKISELSEDDHSDRDCLCIFILTHGLNNDLISAKDVAYRSDVIWKAFTADKCTSLAGKPKLFFFQACRGDKLDRGVVVRRSAERTETDSSVASYKIPTHADFLIAHSTVQGFLSWRNPEEGTWYVQCLCDVIDKHAYTTDLLSMLTITARKVATEYTSYDDLNPAKHEQTQVPSMTSMLIRDIYFSPK